MEEATEKDLEEIKRFKAARRRHQKYSEGDFFTFRIGRRRWGFGRIVLDIAKRRKTEGFSEANPGLAWLMGQSLYIMIYRHISDNPETDLDKLPTYGTLPVQAIMDNPFYYGEYKIIGNRPVEPEEWEPIISLDLTYDYPKDADPVESFFKRPTFPGTAILQYGLICARTDKANLEPYVVFGKQGDSPIYKNAGIGFNIDNFGELEQIIEGNIDNDTLLLSNENRKDLRKRENYEDKAAIFRTLGLDPDRSYAENLRIFKGAT